MSVVLTMPVLLNAQSNWLIGSLLITTYCFWCAHGISPLILFICVCMPLQAHPPNTNLTHPITYFHHTQRVRVLVRKARPNARDARREP